MTTFKFQVGQKYMMLNHPVTVTRRTDKTIWFDFYGETFSRRVKLLENKEYVDYDQHHSIFSPNETSNESQDDVTESQDNQDELVKTYEVSTVEGLENDDNPEYCIHEVTSYSLDSAIEMVKYRLIAQSIRFKILGVCEVVPKVENNEWLEF
jgi:hypothetical protein